MRQLIFPFQVIEDSGCTFMARILGTNGVPVVQSVVASIACKVFSPRTNQSTPTATPTVVVADSIFDTLQTDARWTLDVTGYNFAYEMASTTFTTGDTLYRVEFKFMPTSGDVYYALYEGSAVEVYGS